jgi:predicted pyridoxine 5'-phosphate oxidase superfamily flavin-nucleotide-binding protein
MSRYAQVSYTPAVRELQQLHGSARANAARMEGEATPDRLGPAECAFIAAQRDFMLATVSQTGWPYVQYRGGPPGFLHVVDEQTLAFADVRGNRQYITAGNLATDDRVALLLIDYARALRLKLYGHAKPADPEHSTLAEHPHLARTEGQVERVVVIHVEGFDWNCPKHLVRRFSLDHLQPALDRLTGRIAELEREIARLRTSPSRRRGTGVGRHCRRRRRRNN